MTMTPPLDLQGRRIVLGLTGGIACYKVAEFTLMARWLPCDDSRSSH